MRYPGDSRGSGPGAGRGFPRGPDFTDYVLITLGGILLAISTFLPWVTAGGASDNLFSWARTDTSSLLPYLMVAAGVFLVVSAYRRAPIDRLALGAAVTAVVTIIVAGVDVYDIARAVHQAQDLVDASIGVGIPTAAVAVFLLAVAAVRVQMRSRLLGSGAGAGSGSGGYGSRPGSGGYGSSGRGSGGGRRRWAWGGPRLRSVPTGGEGSGSGRGGSGRFGGGRRRNRPEKRKPITEEAPLDRSPGWKPDPWGVGNSTRYWDGSSWTGQTQYRP